MLSDANHEAEVLWALARAICGGGLVANVPILRRKSLDLLDQGGRRLATGADDRSACTPSPATDEARTLKELGRALVEMRARLELRQ